MNAADTITLRDIYRARQVVAPWVRRTPMVPAKSLSTTIGCDVSFKLETLQETGSFKYRGAIHVLMNLDARQRSRGVVTVSTGNHGLAVARAASRLGIGCAVCLSHLVPANKADLIRAEGADVRIVGQSQDEAQVEAERLVADDGRTMIHPFDHPHVIAGQGTVGLEILEDLPEVGTVLAPVSGGGLIAGVACALKAAAPDIRILGFSMDSGAAMHASLKAGKPVAMAERTSLADALGGGIGLDNRYTFPMVRRLVDDVSLLTEDQIADGMRHLHREEALVVEGGGAVGVSALLHGIAGDVSGRVVVVLSGRNVDIEAFADVVAPRAP